MSSPRPTIASTSLGQLEQTDAVRDGRLRLADAFGDLAEREPELVEQQRVGARLLDRRQILARDVLDEREQERVAVVGLADDRGHSRDAPPRARRASGARRRSARSRPAARGRTTTGWMRPCARIDSARPDDGLGVELACAAGFGFGWIWSTGDVRELGLGAADQNLEAAAETATRVTRRSTSSIATFQ